MTTTHTAVPELPDTIRLQIIQQEIQQLQIEVYKLDATVRALPPRDAQAAQLAASHDRARAILVGYRAQEAELLERLNTIASATP